MCIRDSHCNGVQISRHGGKRNCGAIQSRNCSANRLPINFGGGHCGCLLYTSPRHVAVIMDGNGRWAKKRALNRLRGHKAGIEAVRETIRCANDCGVDYLTIYSFSTENWKRPKEEVSGLMELFAKTMLAEVDGLDVYKRQEHELLCYPSRYGRYSHACCQSV